MNYPRFQHLYSLMMETLDHQLQNQNSRNLSVEQSLRTTPDPLVLVLDGCAILWIIHWPVHGTVDDLFTAIETYLR